MIFGYLTFFLSALLLILPATQVAAIGHIMNVTNITEATLVANHTEVSRAERALLGNCNGAAALQCCLAVVESTDLLAIAALALNGVIPPLIPTQVGLFCLPATAALGHLWYVGRTPFTSVLVLTSEIV